MLKIILLTLILYGCATERNVDTSKPYIFESSHFAPAWVMPDGSFKELTPTERVIYLFGIEPAYRSGK